MSNSQLLMEGHEQRQRLNNPEGTVEHYANYPLKMCRWIAEDSARRIEQSKADFPFSCFRGDCHSHTVHSDGIGTVEQTAEMSRAAGLDFQFVTDHWGVTQKGECAKHGIWWGQEPVTQHHHLGILGLDVAFTPRMDFLEDCREARDRGATIFIPHPTGWWPATQYDEVQKNALFDLPDPFLMEICNGANNMVSAFDYTDEQAIQLWDKLLLAGKIVHAMGNTDAHAPHAIGMVWNGVFAPACEKAAIVETLMQGNSCVSDGPLVHLQMGSANMGSKAELLSDPIAIHAVDSRGLMLVRLIGDGQETSQWNVFGETKFQISLQLPENINKFVRVEVISRDGRRAYTNPIYLG